MRNEPRDSLLERRDAVLEGRKRSSYTGEALRLHDEKAAKDLIRRALMELGLSLEVLQGMRKRDGRKQGVVWLIRRSRR